MTHKSKTRKIKDRRIYWIRKIKKYKGCENCGYDENPVALDFAHIDPLTKHERMCSARKGAGMSSMYSRICIRDMKKNTKYIKELFDEVRKCKILCKNCHVIETQKEFDGKEITKIRGSYEQRKQNFPVDERGNLEAFL
jgi:predicted nuclease with TOPRIM domain